MACWCVINSNYGVYSFSFKGKKGTIRLLSTWIEFKLCEQRFYQHLQGVFLFPNGYKKQKQSKKIPKTLFEKLFTKELWYKTYKRNWDFINCEIQVCKHFTFLSRQVSFCTIMFTLLYNRVLILSKSTILSKFSGSILHTRIWMTIHIMLIFKDKQKQNILL